MAAQRRAVKLLFADLVCKLLCDGGEAVRAAGRARMGPARAVQIVNKMSQRNSMGEFSVVQERQAIAAAIHQVKRIH